jgi:hypothetical protein
VVAGTPRSLRHSSATRRLGSGRSCVTRARPSIDHAFPGSGKPAAAGVLQSGFGRR